MDKDETIKGMYVCVDCNLMLFFLFLTLFHDFALVTA